MRIDLQPWRSRRPEHEVDPKPTEDLKAIAAQLRSLASDVHRYSEDITLAVRSYPLGDTAT